MADSDHDDDSDKSFDCSESSRSNNQVNDTHQSYVDGSVLSGRCRSRLCSVCKHCLQIKNDGHIRIHGPVKMPLSRIQSASTHLCMSETSVSPTYRDSPSSITIRSTDQTFNGPSGAKVIKRILRGCRDQAARKFATVLERVTASNSVETWLRLLHLHRRCFSILRRGGRRWSLTTLINRQIMDENDFIDHVCSRAENSGGGSSSRPPQKITSIHAIASRVSSKLEDRRRLQRCCSPSVLKRHLCTPQLLHH